MSNENAPQEPVKKKKGGALKLVLLSVLLLGAGGGGTYAAFASGMLDRRRQGRSESQAGAKGARIPIRRETARRKTKSRSCMAQAGASIARYYAFTEDLRTSPTVRDWSISLAASTHYDRRVLMWLDEHETALRSRILAELAATSEADLASIKGKEELQQRLTKAINEALEEREGFGGVDNVYFRSFIVQ